MKKDFIEYIKKEFGFDDAEIEKFKSSLNTPLKKSIRVNTNKISVEDFKVRALKNNWTLSPTNLWKNIFYIDREDSKKVALWNTPEHIAGYFYVQEVAASSSPFYLSWDKIDNWEYLILDMSASPWGKTTQLSEYYPNSLIVANELDKSRLKGLFSNIDRMGATNVVVTNYDWRYFKQIPEIFDKILLDAPCSWEWTAFKTDEALKYWNLKNIKNVAKLQFWLLEAAIKSCKPGWEIVYSTCTLNKFENEEVIKKALKKYGDFIEIVRIWENNLWITEQLSESQSMIGWVLWSDSKNIFSNSDKYFKRNWPHLNFTGWFFVAKIKKTSPLAPLLTGEGNKDNKWKSKWDEIKYVKQNIEKISNTDRKKIEEFFKNTFDFDISKYYLYYYKWEVQIIRKSLQNIWDKLFLYKIWVNIWEIKDWTFVPSFYAWTFTRFNKNIVELNKSDLDKLLKWFELDFDLPDWYYQIIYDNLEIWLVKLKNEKLKSLIPTKLMRN